MKGVTRKERIINAMLEGDASGVCGVSREERNLAKVAQATCDGQLGGGGGGGNAGMLILRKNFEGDVTANMSYSELRAALESGNTPVCVHIETVYDWDNRLQSIFQFAEDVIEYDGTDPNSRIDIKFEYHEAMFESDGRIEWASLD